MNKRELQDTARRLRDLAADDTRNGDRLRELADQLDPPKREADLAPALAEVEQARVDLDAARITLDRAIRAAVDAGGTLRAVADAAGVSHETARRLGTVKRAVGRATRKDQTT